MRKLLFLILFLCFFIGIKAQEYYEFPKGNARWGYYYSSFDYFSERNLEYFDIFYINGDTLINDTTYQIISSKRLNNPYGINPIDREFNYYLREERRKIYIRRENNNFSSVENEYIAYDFNLNINDTFVTYGGDSLVMIDESIKYGRRSLHFKSLNRYYQDFFMDYPEPYLQEWVEGIGCTDYNIFWGGYDSHLMCYKFNECDTCSCFDNVITTKSNIPSVIKIKLSPNPVLNNFQLELESNNNTIKIINLQGQVVYQEQIRDKTPTINVEHLSVGIYLVIIIDENGGTSSGKLIKK